MGSVPTFVVVKHLCSITRRSNWRRCTTYNSKQVATVVVLWVDIVFFFFGMGQGGNVFCSLKENLLPNGGKPH